MNRILDNALLDLSRYEINQLGHRDARQRVAKVIEKMIDDRIKALVGPRYLMVDPD